MGSSQYGTIAEQQPLTTEVVTVGTGSSRRGVTITAIALLVFGAAILAFGGSSNRENQLDIPLEGLANSGARACKFEECYSSTCDKEVAPFTCLFNNGGPQKGW